MIAVSSDPTAVASAIQAMVSAVSLLGAIDCFNLNLQGVSLRGLGEELELARQSREYSGKHKSN